MEGMPPWERSALAGCLRVCLVAMPRQRQSPNTAFRANGVDLGASKISTNVSVPTLSVHSFPDSGERVYPCPVQLFGLGRRCRYPPFPAFRARGKVSIPTPPSFSDSGRVSIPTPSSFFDSRQAWNPRPCATCATDRSLAAGRPQLVAKGRRMRRPCLRGARDARGRRLETLAATTPARCGTLEAR